MMSSCVMSTCVMSICVMSICAMSSCVMSVCVCVMSICVVSVCVMSICVMPICVHSYPKRNLHTARRQTRMPARHPHKNFRTSYWHSYPKRNLHTARRQTRMPARHPRKIFAPPFGTATPNAIYTQQAAKPACQEDIDAKFSHLLLAQLPRTQFTHSKPPNPHASRTSTQNFRSSYWHSYPERNLHTASRQTGMPGRHRRKIFAPPIGTATPNAIYTQQAAKPACPEDINTQKQRQSSGDQTTPKRTSDPLQLLQAPRLPRKSSGRAAETKRRQLQVPRLPRKSSDRAAETKRRQSVHQIPCRCSKSHACHAKAATKRRQSVHQTPCRCSKSHACHAKAAAEPRRPNDAKAYIRPPADALKSHACHAKAAAERRRPNDAKAYIRPPADAPSPTPATQKQRQSGGDQTTPKRTSDPLQMLQVPPLPRKSSGRAAETKRRQSVHQTPCSCSKSHACHAKAAPEPRRPNDAKAYIRPPADAPSPTPATQKQRQSGGDQTTPKRTSDPLQMLQVPRLPRKSSGRSAEPKRRQSVHAPSPTPATPKQRQSGGDQTTPKRTSDPVQMLQVPRLPRKSSGRAAETKRRQSVHQTPCRRSKSHACHAKAAAERRRPNDAKAYIRPRAGAPSPTPATQKQRQSGGGQTTPKRTSDPLQMLQVPRLPRKSSGRAAETKRRQSVHQTPCRRSKSHACHAKAAAVKLCDVKLCDVKLRDVKLRDVNLRDVNLRDVKQSDVKLCDVCCVVVCVLMLLYSVM